MPHNKTDLEKFVELYTSIGIPVAVERNETGQWIELRADELPHIKGYNGFFTRIEFDANGKFLEQGVWEE